MAYELIIWDILKLLPSAFSKIKEWHNFNLPASKVFGSILENKTLVRIFLKDLDVPENTMENPKLISTEGNSTQAHPNITKVWPEVEGRGVAELLNLLGRLGKKDKIEITEMSRGYDFWNSNLIVLGAQAVKCMEFYQIMNKVGYRVDEHHIYNFETEQIIEREEGYGYGLIIKAENSNLPKNQKGIGILLGGYGTLGTEAAIYYFCNNVNQLGKEFGKKSFSIIVRARAASGKQSTRRIKSLDKVF